MSRALKEDDNTRSVFSQQWQNPVVQVEHKGVEQALSIVVCKLKTSVKSTFVKCFLPKRVHSTSPSTEVCSSEHINIRYQLLVNMLIKC